MEMSIYAYSDTFASDFLEILKKCNSEAKASELPETFDDMFSRYYMHGDIYHMLNSSTT